MTEQLIGWVRELWRYPVKSMMGESLSETDVYWYGLDGDRRYAFVRSGNQTSFPWLTGRQLPEMTRYRPYFVDSARPADSPLRVETPDGRDLAVTETALAADLSARWSGKEIHLMQLNRGATDTGAVSLVSLATGRRLAETAGEAVDLRRFRQNIILEPAADRPYVEDEWTGGRLVFGDEPDGAALLAIRPIERCQMVNIDPASGRRSAEVLKAVNRSRDNCVGIYLWPQKTGRIRVGDPVRLII